MHADHEIIPYQHKTISPRNGYRLRSFAVIAMNIQCISRRHEVASLLAVSYLYSGVYGIMGKLISFFKDVVSEMRKVSWPKRKELTRYTIVVLSTVVFMAVYFGLIDLGISRVMEWYLAL